jgi:hypothetical protein
MTDLVKEVVEALAADPAEFDAAVEREVDWLKAELDAGTFDNPQPIVGFEHELYGVEDESCRLTRIPRRLVDYMGFSEELGLHNAEMHTSPQPLNQYGLAAQETECRARLAAAVETCEREDIRLVSDGLWTVPPRDGSAREYLSDSVTIDGVRVATNMAENVRYHALSNAAAGVIDYEPGRRVQAPHLDVSTETVVLESLITSIQPHYQMPAAEDLPTYHDYALRAAGPLLALGVNSPFFPADLYDDVPAERVVADAHMENRIAVFEGVFNPREGPGKVRFPEDLETVTEAVDRIAADPTVAPILVEGSGRFDDAFCHLRHKHGSFWRWVRPVFGGPSRSGANARIEFRPIPSQPTVRDGIAFLAAFAGLMEALPRRNHPLRRLAWEDARENFYAAARDGLDAEMTWVTEAKGVTTHRTAIYEELLEQAHDGLVMSGVPETVATEYLAPLRSRFESGVTPARWQHRRVERRVDDGADLGTALHETRHEYVRHQSETVVEGAFADWPDADT